MDNEILDRVTARTVSNIDLHIDYFIWYDNCVFKRNIIFEKTCLKKIKIIVMSGQSYVRGTMPMAESAPCAPAQTSAYR